MPRATNANMERMIISLPFRCSQGSSTTSSKYFFMSIILVKILLLINNKIPPARYSFKIVNHFINPLPLIKKIPIITSGALFLHETFRNTITSL